MAPCRTIEVLHCTSEDGIYKEHFILKSKHMGMKMVFSPVTSSEMKNAQEGSFLVISCKMVTRSVYKAPRSVLTRPLCRPMSQGEPTYLEPSVFKPERFLDTSGQLATSNRSVAFGFSNRICPGQYLAGSTLCQPEN